jgi:hypothetical protein
MTRMSYTATAITITTSPREGGIDCSSGVYFEALIA